jgi:hypothetical protein
MDNKKNCKWIEIFMNPYGDKIEWCICHLNPQSKKVDLEHDCKDCPHYLKEEDVEDER